MLLTRTLWRRTGLPREDVRRVVRNRDVAVSSR